MPSVACYDWSVMRAAALDEIEHAHRSVGGTGRGRRYLTQQLNQAYAVLLSSQFQGFCLDLHEECVIICWLRWRQPCFRRRTETICCSAANSIRGTPIQETLGRTSTASG